MLNLIPIPTREPLLARQCAHYTDEMEGLIIETGPDQNLLAMWSPAAIISDRLAPISLFMVLGLEGSGNLPGDWILMNSDLGFQNVSRYMRETPGEIDHLAAIKDKIKRDVTKMVLRELSGESTSQCAQFNLPLSFEYTANLMLGDRVAARLLTKISVDTTAEAEGFVVTPCGWHAVWSPQVIDDSFGAMHVVYFKMPTSSALTPGDYFRTDLCISTLEYISGAEERRKKAFDALIIGIEGSFNAPIGKRVVIGVV